MKNIRKADMHDVSELAEMIKIAFTDVFKRLKLSPEDVPRHPSNIKEEWIKDAVAKGVDYYIYEENGESLGCYAMEKAKEHVCYLERLAVLPCHRQKGIGKKMVGSAVLKASSLGFTRMEIGIIANDYPLFRFYKKCGFVYNKTCYFKHLPYAVGFMALELRPF